MGTGDEQDSKINTTKDSMWTRKGRGGMTMKGWRDVEGLRPRKPTQQPNERAKKRMKKPAPVRC